MFAYFSLTLNVEWREKEREGEREGSWRVRKRSTMTYTLYVWYVCRRVIAKNELISPSH